MKFAIIDLESLKEIDKGWEHRRRSNDGTKAIIHLEILQQLMPAMPMTMDLQYDENGEVQEPNYPFPVVDGSELDKMPEFMPKEDLEIKL